MNKILFIAAAKKCKYTRPSQILISFIIVYSMETIAERIYASIVRSDSFRMHVCVYNS